MKLTEELAIWMTVAPTVGVLLVLFFGVLPAWLDRRDDSERSGDFGRADGLRRPTMHDAPFRPYTVAAARGVVRAHACCDAGRCGAKAAALSVLIAAGMMRYPAQARHRRLRA